LGDYQLINFALNSYIDNTASKEDKPKLKKIIAKIEDILMKN
jgi:hypothetical protein